MRKQLTPTEKLYVIREARKLYIKVLEEGYGTSLCSMLGYALENMRILDKWRALAVQELLPELLDYKPSHKGAGELWWPREATKPRLAVLDNLEARYYAETTWWSRMWFKIKNMRIWKS